MKKPGRWAGAWRCPEELIRDGEATVAFLFDLHV
jgi:hypothetical protein